MAHSKSKEKITTNSPSFWKADLSNEQYFIENMQKVGVYLENIAQQLVDLKLLYNQSVSDLNFNNNPKLDAQIEKDLKAIYNNGSCVMEILKKTDPSTLFNQTPLSKEKRLSYQTQHDTNCCEFKRLWVILYDLKKDHQSRTLALVKIYTQANYPNAHEEEITSLAQTMVTTNCIAFEKYTTAQEALQYVTLRHKEILKLEASVDEVHQLFVDLWALTQQQGYTIEAIRENIQSAKNNIQNARNDLEQAHKSQKKHWYS